MNVYFTAGDTSFVQGKAPVRTCPSSAVNATFVHSLACSFVHLFVHSFIPSFLYSFMEYMLQSCSVPDAMLGAGPIIVRQSLLGRTL